jgi:hypothetical protein
MVRGEGALVDGGLISMSWPHSNFVAIIIWEQIDKYKIKSLSYTQLVRTRDLKPIFYWMRNFFQRLATSWVCPVAANLDKYIISR